MENPHPPSISKVGNKIYFHPHLGPVKLGSNEYTDGLEVGVYVIGPAIACSIKLLIGRLKFNNFHLTC